MVKLFYKICTQIQNNESIFDQSFFQNMKSSSLIKTTFLACFESNFIQYQQEERNSIDFKKISA